MGSKAGGARVSVEQAVIAPCRSHDPEWWFSSAREELSKAMSLCRSCSHMTECLAGALARGEAAGVWGGRYLVEGRIAAVPGPWLPSRGSVRLSVSRSRNDEGRG
ncbi:WhiB family transcriptional regulator [Rhodococcus erythropolis]|jgi:WhiB family redox-sensing transcriptional regulator|uniref:WhiB family transcriptional regulator n=1 Tax=Rhodococcus erythropolis TaxID=1833 RepID=UPI0035574D61